MTTPSRSSRHSRSTSLTWMPRVLLGTLTVLLAVLTLAGIMAAGAISTSRAIHPSHHAPTGGYGR